MWDSFNRASLLLADFQLVIVHVVRGFQVWRPTGVFSYLEYFFVVNSYVLQKLEEAQWIAVAGGEEGAGSSGIVFALIPVVEYRRKTR